VLRLILLHLRGRMAGMVKPYEMAQNLRMHLRGRKRRVF
jgi:hypothetical protein